jgi:hypothetical protein
MTTRIIKSRKSVHFSEAPFQVKFFYTDDIINPRDVDIDRVNIYSSKKTVSSPVYLENAFPSVSNNIITSSWAVQNIAFKKSVTVRYTLDAWSTIKECYGRYENKYNNLDYFKHLINVSQPCQSILLKLFRVNTASNSEPLSCTIIVNSVLCIA